MSDIPIEQAIYSNAGSGGYRFLARSLGFLDEWLPAAEELCTGFGERPAGVACPQAVFARPLGADRVAVVQVADQGADDAGRPGALGFHILVLPRQAYATFIGDPFVVAERCPPPWSARDELPAVSWPEEPLPPRTVEQVQRVLKEGDMATLLGGVQALVDGSRLLFARPAPDPRLLRDLWSLLPDRTRCELWPASFAFGNALHFDAVVLPRVEACTADGYLTEEQAGDYPEGRYEARLQTAAQTGDQGQLDHLFSRRSSKDTLKLALVLVGVFLAVAAVANFLNRDFPRTTSPTTRPALPPLAKKYVPMRQGDRLKVAVILADVAKQLGVSRPASSPTIEEWLTALDERLGPPDPRRAPGPLTAVAPRDTEKQLRLFLWKHDVPGYDDPRLNPVELAERLQEKLAPPKREGPP